MGLGSERHLAREWERKHGHGLPDQNSTPHGVLMGGENKEDVGLIRRWIVWEG